MQEKFKFYGAFNGNKNLALVCLILSAVLAIYSVICVISNFVQIFRGNIVAIPAVLFYLCWLLAAVLMLANAKDFSRQEYKKLSTFPMILALAMVFNIISIFIIMVYVGLWFWMIRSIILSLVVLVLAILTAVRINKDEDSTFLPLVLWAVAAVIFIIDNFASIGSVIFALVNFAILALAILCYTDLVAFCIEPVAAEAGTDTETEAEAFSAASGAAGKKTTAQKAPQYDFERTIEDLKKLKELYDAQLLTENEYEEKRKQLVEKL
jgi:MFS family permease